MTADSVIGSRAVSTGRARGRVATLALMLLWMLCCPAIARANGRRCEGPALCCPAEVADEYEGHATVSLGVVLVGLYNVNERAGTWDADFYLYEEWTPAERFTPQTEVVNEVTRQSEQFDATQLVGGRCMRSRRLHLTLHNRYNLRTFPFDRQRLSIEFSDAAYNLRGVRYGDAPARMGLSDEARDQLFAWRIDGPVRYARAARAFEWETAAPRYDYARFELPVHRHIAFHLTRFFLPLFVILMVALAVFWISPEDLSSQVSIGVTCLLAAIAFQYAEGGNLPEVSYLTLADRVYCICYIAIALAILESVFTNSLQRRGEADRAKRIDRACRWAFPLGVVLAVALSVLRSVWLGRM